jgi:hypothetical protein
LLQRALDHRLADELGHAFTLAHYLGMRPATRSASTSRRFAGYRRGLKRSWAGSASSSRCTSTPWNRECGEARLMTHGRGSTRECGEAQLAMRRGHLVTFGRAQPALVCAPLARKRAEGHAAGRGAAPPLITSKRTRGFQRGSRPLAEV